PHLALHSFPTRRSSDLGLVTIEDILEEIVGEIRDEYDVEEPQIQQEGTDRFWVSGLVPLDELSERLDVDFGVEDVTTVGGLVYADRKSTRLNSSHLGIS